MLDRKPANYRQWAWVVAAVVGVVLIADGVRGLL